MTIPGDLFERTLRALAWLGLGALCAVGSRLSCALGAEPFEPGPVRVWAADRDGGRVFGLDRGLFVRAARRVPFPVRVAARGQGVVVASAVGGSPRSAHRLLVLDADARPLHRLDCGPVRALATSAEGDVLWIEGREDGPRRLFAWRPAEELRELPGGERAERLVVWDSGRVLCCGGGEARAFDLAAAERTARSFAVPALTDVAAAGEAGAWMLTEDGVVLRWTGEGAPRFHARLGEDTSLVAARAGGVWAGDAAGREWRGTRWRRRPLRVAPLPLVGIQDALALADGGLLLAAPGAVLELGPSGRLRNTQGGFDFLVSLALVRAGGPLP